MNQQIYVWINAIILEDIVILNKFFHNAIFNKNINNIVFKQIKI